MTITLWYQNLRREIVNLPTLIPTEDGLMQLTVAPPKLTIAQQDKLAQHFERRQTTSRLGERNMTMYLQPPLTLDQIDYVIMQVAIVGGQEEVWYVPQGPIFQLRSRRRLRSARRDPFRQSF